MFTGISVLLTTVSPLGSWGSYAYSMTNFFEAIVMTVSFGGLSMINLLLSFYTSVVCQAMEAYLGFLPEIVTLQQKRNGFGDLGAAYEPSMSSPILSPEHASNHYRSDSGGSTHSSESLSRKFRRTFADPINVFITLAVASAFYGSFFVPFASYFYQQSITTTAPQLVPVGCMIGMQGTTEQFLNRTAALARAGSKIVLWSEAATSVNRDAGEQEFWAMAGAKAAELGIYLGATYAVSFFFFSTK
jgi:hypothetical protein